MLEWFSDNQTLLTWLSVISLITFVGSLLALPWLVGVIPEDYFLHQRRNPADLKQRHPMARLLLLVGKNLLGVLLLCGGILMLFLPGQGLLTLAVGMLLLDYPGKFSIERRIVSYPSILKGINWLRAKGNHPPIKVDS
jgi:archaellum biogenesis protein FlaJ (TadC family)